MSQPKTVIIVKTKLDRLVMFDVSHNTTGYMLADLTKQEFTFNFNPLDETKNVADAVLLKEEGK